MSEQELLQLELAVVNFPSLGVRILFPKKEKLQAGIGIMLFGEHMFVVNDAHRSL